MGPLAMDPRPAISPGHADGLTMRPEILNPLFAEVEALKGVGPNVAKGLARLDLTRAIDLVFHLPTGMIDRLRIEEAGGRD